MNGNILFIILIELIGLIIFFSLYKKEIISLKRFKAEMIFLIEVLFLNLSLYFNYNYIFLIILSSIILTRIYIAKKIICIDKKKNI
jgi:hypothetical protein